MANPKFTDSNGNQPYIWQELPVLPSDRMDIDEPLNTDRAIIEYLRSGVIIGIKYLATRGKWTVTWHGITQAMVLLVKPFFGMAYFRVYADADLSSYKEVYISNNFSPRRTDGNYYDLTLELKQYSP